MPDRRYGASISISIHALRKESDDSYLRKQ